MTPVRLHEPPAGCGPWGGGTDGAADKTADGAVVGAAGVLGSPVGSDGRHVGRHVRQAPRSRRRAGPELCGVRVQARRRSKSGRPPISEHLPTQQASSCCAATGAMAEKGSKEDDESETLAEGAAMDAAATD